MNPGTNEIYEVNKYNLKQEKHHMWVQIARLYLHLMCIKSNKYQNSGILGKTIRKPEKVAMQSSS